MKAVAKESDFALVDLARVLHSGVFICHCNLVVLLEKPWKRKEEGLLAVLSLSPLFWTTLRFLVP